MVLSVLNVSNSTVAKRTIMNETSNLGETMGTSYIPKSELCCKLSIFEVVISTWALSGSFLIYLKKHSILLKQSLAF